MDKHPDHLCFLTDDENRCLVKLNEIQELFNSIVLKDPQCSSDTINFGRNIDYARDSLIMRGARRLDPDHLIKKTLDYNTD